MAARSTHVHVVEGEVGPYAQRLGDLEEGTEERRAPSSRSPARRENDAAFWLTLDAVNFGSGWFPTLHKRSEKTGYRTIAAGIRRRFDEAGRWTPAQLAALTDAELAGWIDQAPEHELVGLMVTSLRDLGENVQRLYGRSFAAAVDAAGGSAVGLVETLAGWRCFADVSVYDGRAVPFLKRAQIVAADLQRAGVVEFSDLGRLTMFADNLVPHVLRLDGVLWFAPELVARIEREELIEHGSAEEIEIRACAVHAVELIVAAASEMGPAHPNAAQIDEILWNRGQTPEYKAVPRHRSRSTAY
ncbi:MAG TPA: queuosine salvage family protein [Solirubrobacteraceae bacterium]|nr:queuosine salvage family protein [Solirubrobacteraceae bacterium]